jgi:hypothetical protein
MAGNWLMIDPPNLLGAWVRIEQFDPKAEAGRLRACFEMTRAGWPVNWGGSSRRPLCT